MSWRKHVGQPLRWALPGFRREQLVVGRNLYFVALCLLSLSLASCKERSVEPQASAPGKQESTQPDTQTPEPGTPRRRGEESEQRHQLTVPTQALEGKTFQTALVERRALRDELQATATIKPNEYRLVHVSPRIEGRAIDIQVQLGDQVKPGQPLALLDSIELGQKKAALLQAMTNRDVDQRNFEREKRLFEQRISSEKEYLAAKGAYDKSVTAYRAAYEALRLIGLSDEEITKINWSEKGKPLSYFPLLAPQAGTLIERPFTRGELITPKDNAFTIVDLSTVWILLDIYEQHLAAVTVGSEVEIKVDAYPRETFHGKIVYLSYVLKPETRTVDARVEIPNPGLRLRPGMFARATLQLSNTNMGQKVIVVPQDAIQQVDEKPVAFVEERPGTYTVRQVVIGRRSGTDAEVRSGLAEGERVVTEGSFYLKSILLKEQIAGD